MGSNLCIGMANSSDPRLVLENCTADPTQQWQPEQLINGQVVLHNLTA